MKGSRKVNFMKHEIFFYFSKKAKKKLVKSQNWKGLPMESYEVRERKKGRETNDEPHMKCEGKLTIIGLK